MTIAELRALEVLTRCLPRIVKSLNRIANSLEQQSGSKLDEQIEDKDKKEDRYESDK